MNCEVYDLGLCDYMDANKVQLEILNKVKTGDFSDALLLAEFFPVFTIGRKGSPENLLVSEDFLSKEGIVVYNVNRGGDITGHNPGQLVVYPIFNLSHLKKDLDWYLRSLEEVIIRLLDEYGISAGRKKGLTGVWAADKKIASIGIAVSRWCAYHGIALNINNDLSIFDYINPCGIKKCGVTSVSELKGVLIEMAELKKRLINNMSNIFNLEIASAPPGAGPRNDTNECIATASVA